VYNINDCLRPVEALKLMADIMRDDDAVKCLSDKRIFHGVELDLRLDEETLRVERDMSSSAWCPTTVRFYGKVRTNAIDKETLVRYAVMIPAYNGHGWFIAIDKRVFKHG
jgi:hypothetical protein